MSLTVLTQQNGLLNAQNVLQEYSFHFSLRPLCTAFCPVSLGNTVYATCNIIQIVNPNKHRTEWLSLLLPHLKSYSLQIVTYNYVLVMRKQTNILSFCSKQTMKVNLTMRIFLKGSNGLYFKSSLKNVKHTGRTCRSPF